MENLTPTPPVPQKTSHWLRNLIVVAAAIVMAGLGFLAYQNPQLFRAAITGGGSQEVDVDIYIPSTVNVCPSAAGELIMT